MVFHSFDVVVNDVLIETKQRQEIGEELVPSSDVARESFAGRSQDEAAIFFVLEETVGVEALDHVSHAGLRNLETGRDIDDARVTLRIDQFENSLEVILDRGGIAFGIFSGDRHGSAKMNGLLRQVKIKVFER